MRPTSSRSSSIGRRSAIFGSARPRPWPWSAPSSAWPPPSCTSPWSVAMSMRRPRPTAALRLLGTYLLAGSFAGAAAFPLYWMVVAALQPGRELFSYPPRLLPRVAELGVFGRLFATQPMLLWIGNTVLIAGGVALLSVALAVLAAYALSRFRFAGRRGLQFVLLLT